jgi:glycosyltransferase involved in cell wall biosynthesis
MRKARWSFRRIRWAGSGSAYESRVFAGNMVSVIIPTYNRAEHVTEAVDSVLGQTYTHYELIVVDDGSTDDTRKVLQERYGERIRYLYQPNKGPSGARNTGIRAARHELLAFLDSDDTWFPRKLEIQVPLMSDQGVVLSYTNSVESKRGLRHDRPAMVEGQDWFSEIGLYLDDEPAILDVPLRILLHKGFSGIMTPTVMSRKRAVERAGGFDERMDTAEDLRLWLRLAFEGRFAVTSQPLACRRWLGSGKQLTEPAQLAYHKKNENSRLEVFMECYARAIDQPADVQHGLRQFIAHSLAQQAKQCALDGKYSIARRRAFECLAFTPKGRTLARALVGWLFPQFFPINARRKTKT